MLKGLCLVLYCNPTKNEAITKLFLLIIKAYASEALNKVPAVYFRL